MLAEVKLYLRIDEDIEDELINSLISAAENYIKSASGKTRTADGKPLEEDELFKTAVKMLVAHWYDNRGTEYVGKTVSKIGNSFNMLLSQITVSEDYL